MKMRNKLYSVMALCAMVLVSACGDHETPVFTDSFISFNGGTRTVTESGAAFEIEITASAPGESSGVTLAGSATEGVDYTISTTSVSAGNDYTTTITITPINNLITDGTRTAELTLTDGGYPGGADGKVFTVTILDDDCPFDAAAFTGDFNVDDPENPFVGNGTVANNYTLGITEDPATANRFIVDDILNLSGVSATFAARSMFMDLNPDLNTPTVTIPVQPLQPRVTSSGFRIGIGSTADGEYVSCSGAMSVPVQILALVDDGGTTVGGAFTAAYTLAFTR